MLGLLVGQQRMLSLLAHNSTTAATSQAVSALLNLSSANAHALPAQHAAQPHSPHPLSALHLALAHSSTHGSSTSTASMSTSAQPALRQPHLPQPILSPPSHVSVSAHPPVSRVGPLTVQYPFPVEYYNDREVVVRNLARGTVQGLEVLPGPIFNVPVRLDLLHRVVRWLRAAWQQGTHKAKRRSEVRGGGKKPWPQKGTGRARHGSIRSPIFRKGGVAHGPKPRSHAHQLPLPIQLHGYKCALSARANEGRLILVDSLQPLPVGGEFGQLPEPSSSRKSKSSSSSSSSNSLSLSKPMIKTKATLAQLQALLQGAPPFRSALLVDSGPEAPDGGDALRKGARNLPWVTIMPWYEVTVYDLLKHGALVMTTGAAAQLTQRLLRPPLHYKQVRKPLRLEWLARQQAALGEALAQLQQAAVHTPSPARQRRWLHGKQA